MSRWVTDVLGAIATEPGFDLAKGRLFARPNPLVVCLNTDGPAAALRLALELGAAGGAYPFGAYLADMRAYELAVAGGAPRYKPRQRTPISADESAAGAFRELAEGRASLGIQTEMLEGR